MKRLSHAALFVFILSFFMPIHAEAALLVPADFSFNTDLKQGSVISPDVSYLQNVLNQSANTRVAGTGPGSDSALTASFGAKTKDAVMRFQSLYAADILSPANLAAPTGIVGKLTRAKLNNVLQSLRGGQTTAAVPTTQTTTIAASTTALSSFAATATIGNSSAINIFGLSSYGVVPGQAMSIFGQGFDKDVNTLQIGDKFIKNASSQDGGTLISFPVPNIPSGSYSVIVYNKYGIGSSGPLALKVMAATSSTSSEEAAAIVNTAIFGSTSGKTTVVTPTLTTLSPKSSKLLTQVIVLYGSGFTADNTILTSLGNLYHVPSGDGQTLNFTVGTLPYYASMLAAHKGQTGDLSIEVSNSYGTTKMLTHSITFPASGNIADAAPASASDIIDSTADFQKYVASTSYSYYLPFVSASSSADDILKTYGLVGAVNLDSYTGLTGGSATSGTTAGTSAASKPAYMSTDGTINPYYIVKSSQDTSVPGTASGSVSAATTSLASVFQNLTPNPGILSGYFGGVIQKLQKCTADNSVLATIIDYSHLYKTYNVIYVPGTTKVGGSSLNDTVGIGAIVSGTFTLGNRSCMAGTSGSTEPQVLIDTAVSTLTLLQKMN